MSTEFLHTKYSSTNFESPFEKLSQSSSSVQGSIINNNNNNNNGKVHPRTRYEGIGSLLKRYSFFNLGAKWEWVIVATPQPLYPPGKRSCAHCIGGWVGPRDGLGTYDPSKCHEANTQPHVATTQNTSYLNTKTSLHLIKSFGALISSGQLATFPLDSAISFTEVFSFSLSLVTQATICVVVIIIALLTCKLTL